MWFRNVCLMVVCLCMGRASSLIYDYYSGNVVPPDYVLRYAHSDSFRSCTVDVEECYPHEVRRVDGSCNNVKHPTSAMQRGQYGRILPPFFGPNNTIASFAADGSPLPLARRVRTALQPSMRVVSSRFNMALLHIGGFHTLDVTKIIPANYLVDKTDCCTPAGANDPVCIPMYVPKDDPYLSHKGIACMNLTRAQTFQELGCVTNDKPAAAINHETPLIDLSPVYGTNRSIASSLRVNEKGLLKMDYRKKRYVPGGKESNCYANKPSEPCYQMGDSTLNFQPKSTLFGIWFSRLHNSFASQLALINPCYNDEQLFQQARQIAIAIEQNIIFYEMFPLILGLKNMLDRGLLSKDGGFLNCYNPREIPRTLAEYEVGLRALHSLVDDAFGLYDKNANLIGTTSLNRWIFAVGVLENGNNMEEMSRSIFYQASADSTRFVDPGMSNNMFTRFHKANDLFSIDIQRGRDLGMRPYNEYRKHCGLPYAHKFSDFADVMNAAQIKVLKSIYKTVDSVELTAGIRAEREVEGGAVGPTLFCIIEEQLRILRDGDRFWFENGNQKNSLTYEQLQEIRKYTLSRFACDTVDGLHLIQPQAFLIPSLKNPLVSCDKIRQIDLSKWRDDFCDLTPEGRQQG